MKAGEGHAIETTGGVEIKANVYFQPPESVKMEYPCIRYKQLPIEKRSANNGVYIKNHPFEVIYISPRPDSVAPELLANYPMSRQLSVFQADGLYHYSFKLYI